MKGFKVTFSKRRKFPRLHFEFIGDKQKVSNLDFGDGKEPIIKCVGCGAIHWKDMTYKFKKKDE